MKDFFTYLTAGEEDKNWGLYLNVAGKANIAPKTVYPSLDHPTGYYFHWSRGRVLQEYQINYITEGNGVLENEFGKFPIRPGSLLIVRPGDWHRYRPLKKVGWVEHYIGFEGELAEKLLNQSVFAAKPSVIHCGIREELLDTYYKIFDLAQKEEPGFQQICSGLVIKLLGYLITFQKKRNLSGKHIEKVIQKARFHMRENLEDKVDLQAFAEEHRVGYAYLRKMFKNYTGVSPHQYHLELKIMRAKELLLTTQKSIKEIGYELGFESVHYFSRLFKKKTGFKPTEIRENTLLKPNDLDHDEE